MYLLRVKVTTKLYFYVKKVNVQTASNVVNVLGTSSVKK